MSVGDDATPILDRDALLADRSLVGVDFCATYARKVDEWLEALFAQRIGDRRGIALVAIGGYGRSALSPQSDLDIMLLHDGWAEAELTEAASALWHPIWDAHIELGHSVRTVKQSQDLAKSDLDTATSLLSLRHLAGDRRLSKELAKESQRRWRRSRRQWLPRIIEDARERERLNGELAFLLEPDLKVSGGGLRDLDAVAWIDASGIPVLAQERVDLRASKEVLLAARVELHRSTQRKGDRLFLEQQDGVADALGIGHADAMMSEIAASARTVRWIAERVFQRVDRRLRSRPRLAERPKVVAEGVVAVGNMMCLDPSAPVADDPALMFRIAIASAEHNAPIDRHSLDILVERGAPTPTPWTAEMRALFVRLLMTGDSSISVIETLEHVGLLTRVLPEWEPTRSKVQRNQYHRFTVDRHLLETAAIASSLAERVCRPDLLVVGALLHDIGKGYPGDHTEVGVELIDTIATNMGFDPDDVDTLKRLCEHHLLLPDVATRRDIEDPGTISSVAAQVASVDFLNLLAALTEADSIATGPAAWSRWKAHLLGELTRFTTDWLESGGHAEVESHFPNPEQLHLLATNDHLVQGNGDTLTVVTEDRPGVFARVAGAMSLNFLNIVEAHTHVADGKAIEVVRVVHADGEDIAIDWPRVVDETEEVLQTDEDLAPHFAIRARSRLGRVVRGPSSIVGIKVEFHNDISAESTVIDVAGPDRLGLLHELSSVLVDAGLDQQQTRVQTMSREVVDAFYVQTLDGSKVTDPVEQESIRAALLAVLNRVESHR